MHRCRRRRRPKPQKHDCHSAALCFTIHVWYWLLVLVSFVCSRIRHVVNPDPKAVFIYPCSLALVGGGGEVRMYADDDDDDCPLKECGFFANRLMNRHLRDIRAVGGGGWGRTA